MTKKMSPVQPVPPTYPPPPIRREQPRPPPPKPKPRPKTSARETFLGFDIFERRRSCDGAFLSSRVVAYYAERRVERSQCLEARTLKDLKTMIRGLVAARRKGIIR